MRAVILTLILLASAVLPGRPHSRPRFRPPVRHAAHVTGRQASHARPVSWKAIAAGGVAVSGAVFAYKVGDGIQQGTMEVARTRPEAFAGAGDDMAGIIGVASGVSALLIVAYLIWLLLSRRRRPPAD